MKKFTRRSGLIGVSVGAIVIITTGAALTAGIASAAPAAPAIPKCHSGQMRVWTGSPGDGFAGGIAWQLEISNIGHHACTLFGYPGVSELNGSEHQVGKPASHSGLKTTVVIRPGGTSHVLLTIHDPAIVCPGHAIRGSFLRVFAPNQFNAELTPFRVDVCPHSANMDVDAVHAGTGIPGFSGP